MASLTYTRDGAPRWLPLVGHGLAMRQDPLAFFRALQREHGGVAPVHLGPARGVVLSDPEPIGEVLVTHRDRYTRMAPVYEAMAGFLGQGILTTEAPAHRSARLPQAAARLLHRRHRRHHRGGSGELARRGGRERAHDAADAARGQRGDARHPHRGGRGRHRRGHRRRPALHGGGHRRRLRAAGLRPHPAPPGLSPGGGDPRPSRQPSRTSRSSATPAGSSTRRCACTRPHRPPGGWLWSPTPWAVTR